MSELPEAEKAAAGPSPTTPPRSGEGADTALEALIRKRKLRAEDDNSGAAEPDDGSALPPK